MRKRIFALLLALALVWAPLAIGASAISAGDPTVGPDPEPSYSLTEIPAVSVSASEPSAGSQALYDYELPEGSRYRVDYLEWYCGDQLLTKGSVFESGKSYRLVVFLQPEGGYCFPVDVQATLNREPATVEFMSTSAGIRISRTYALMALDEISEIVLTVSAPALGEEMQDVEAPADANYYVHRTTWHDNSDKDYTHKVSGAFQAGIEYGVFAYVLPKAGCVFSPDGVKVIFNGTAQESTYLPLEGGELYVIQRFPALDSRIRSVAVTAPVPMAGAGVYDEEFELPYNAFYSVTGYWWAEEGTFEFNVEPTVPETFEAGKRYEILMVVEPNEGYRFAPALEVTVNGMAASFYDATKMPGYPQYVNPEAILVTKSFGVPGATPFADVGPNDYCADAVDWAYNSEPQVTKGTDETHFDPEGPVTRGQAVTFLWRAVGCPEPKTEQNPFLDVSERDYFYKAVLWAVENNITAGVNRNHFNPSDGCSTAHIITFLFRTMNQDQVKAGVDGWYQTAAQWGEDWGLFGNGLDLSIDPNTPCPRGAVVTYLFRTLAGTWAKWE